MKAVVLVGNPNVGKSVLFYQLTGNYVTVSNYPGTTVEVSHGLASIEGRQVRVYDSPGIYSLWPLTEEEAITKRLLLEKRPAVVVHVVDAKNLPRMLPLTLELQACGFSVILVLNMLDEAKRLGVQIKRGELASRLGIAVVEAAFVHGWGVNALRRQIAEQLNSRLTTRPLCQAAIMPEQEQRDFMASALQRRQAAEKILEGVYSCGDLRREAWLDRLTLHPVLGLLFSIVAIYVGVYLLVGRLGAGLLVDLFDGVLFAEIIIPRLTAWIGFLPWQAVRELLAGDFGILTMGFRYAFGIIMPMVGTFFFAFAFLEDSGYLPRLAYWADGLLKKIGLNGRAIIPLVLGFGCGTMAVVATRTLESRRERIAATFLLALAIPCSAQLGLLLAMLSGAPFLLLVWCLVVLIVFIVAGSLLNILLPGKRAAFFMELPPLRTPKLGALLQKTLARMRWYFMEVVPVFVFISILLWLLAETGLLASLVAGLVPLVGMLGLPPEMALVFLYGFFRRDYGAAGLFDLYRSETLSGAQMLVAAVALTLFLPCLAQLTMIARERGVPVAAAIVFLVSMTAFAAALLLRLALALPVW
ncbi:MAG: ferrous iron transporter B [Dethiobacter sp.]|nr:ferrous iron transporter B [Dethiobacter sp.]MBS3899874.1 ferrous iron transporter B [Dethiobacter sp.]MBS3982225.1 ferrous iron transporter B [Dethiobacter sp.]MCL4463688.1 ferrous iron transporter B [Bacillota bacterium]MCL5994062.1 ferrous iron transporter B [Bacillota bacterium]